MFVDLPFCRDSAVRPFPRPSSHRRKGPLVLSLLLVLSWTLLIPESASAKPKTHTVYAGQRLGSIAKRYNVSIDELCAANGINRKSTIRPGQKLIIPGTDDGTSAKDSKEANNEKKQKDSPPPRPQGKTRTHVVAKGHTLSAIAGRYAITVTALCNANGISRHASLTVGEQLIIPHKTDKDGEYAKKQRLRGDFDEKSDEGDDDAKSKESASDSKKSWTPYVRPAWRRGFIKIRRYGRYWEGYVIGPKNEVLGHASNKINFVLGAHSDGPRIDPKLVRLIASVSDKFGGREMRIVSGYRTKSFVAASKHKQGKALDFSIPGIPNEALRDYLRTIDDVGVGYYPNSSFVHLDVRGYNSYWIDMAGPGEAPRKTKKSEKTRKSTSKTPKTKDDAEETSDETDTEDEHEGSHGTDNDDSSTTSPTEKTPKTGGEKTPKAETEKTPKAGGQKTPKAEGEESD